MAGTKEIRLKIKSIQGTRKITKAMEMVAASKMKKAQDRMRASRPYVIRALQIAMHVAKANTEYKHPFLAKRETVRRVGAIVVTTDKGLCGAMNTNLLRLVLQHYKEWQSQGEEIDVCCIGNKGFTFMQRLGAPEGSWDYIYEPEARAVLDQVLTRYIEAVVYQGVSENMASEQSARMRSCALRIFDAATISIALVIFRVFCTLRIFTRISFVPGMGALLERPRFLPVLDRLVQRLLVVGGEILLGLHRVDERAVLALQVVAHRAFGRERLLDLDIVEVAVVRREQGERHLPDLLRLVLRLLHQLGHHAAALELLAGRLVEVGGELRERRQLAELRERQAHAAAGVAAFHDLGLRRAAHP